MSTYTMSQQTNHTDVYLNDFHKAWVERSREKRALRQSMRYSHEFAKAQSDRMNALVQKEEERLRIARKKT